MAYKMGLGSAGRRGRNSSCESDWHPGPGRRQWCQDQGTTAEKVKRVVWRGIWRLFEWRWEGGKSYRMTSALWLGVWVDGPTEVEDLEEGHVSLVDSAILCLWDFLVEVPRKWGGCTSLSLTRALMSGKIWGPGHRLSLHLPIFLLLWLTLPL